MARWRDILEFPGYQVSDDGQVRSNMHGLLRSFVSRITGYRQIALRKNRQSVHRLVAVAFCDGHFVGAQVNHKNGIRTDNRCENLEWVTPGQNIEHAFRVLGRAPTCEGVFSGDHPTSKGVVRIDLATGDERFYAAGMDAVREGFDSSAISRCCHRIKRTHAGYGWRFATLDDVEKMMATK